MVRLLRIAGDSLLPEYRDGDFVLVAKIPYLFSEAHPGDVVAFRHVTYGTLVKIVDEVLPGGHEITVLGSHPGSVDSRTFGPIRCTDVLGRVIWHVRRPAYA
jgi:signal peptidase I